MTDLSVPERRLRAVLASIRENAGTLIIAVSGGVDSMTLAAAAHRWLGPGAMTAAHSASPAAPTAATGRVMRMAEAEGWRLEMVDAGEFADPLYRNNPVNRCFYCKNNLYAALSRIGGGVICSGANLDDLGDYRPGLKAAADHQVRHPYIEAEMHKAAVRALARRLGLREVAELPSAPCLASRVETGLRVEPETLARIDAVETWARSAFALETVRCRRRREGFVIEVDALSLSRLDPAVLQAGAAVLLEGKVPLVEPYRRGSAFVAALDPGRAAE